MRNPEINAFRNGILEHDFAKGPFESHGVLVRLVGNEFTILRGDQVDTRPTKAAVVAFIATYGFRGEFS